MAKEDIVSGYEYQKGQYVELEPEEIAGVKAKNDESIGIASFPHDGLSAAELVAAADRALARAIELGGNRTVLVSIPRDAPPGWGLARAS